jgi:hypothetical protein
VGGGTGAASKQEAAHSFPSMSIPCLRALMEAHAPLVQWMNKVLAEQRPRFQ